MDTSQPSFLKCMLHDNCEQTQFCCQCLSILCNATKQAHQLHSTIPILQYLSIAKATLISHSGNGPVFSNCEHRIHALEIANLNLNAQVQRIEKYSLFSSSKTTKVESSLQKLQNKVGLINSKCAYIFQSLEVSLSNLRAQTLSKLSTMQENVALKMNGATQEISLVKESINKSTINMLREIKSVNENISQKEVQTSKCFDSINANLNQRKNTEENITLKIGIGA